MGSFFVSYKKGSNHPPLKALEIATKKGQVAVTWPFSLLVLLVVDVIIKLDL